MAYRKALTVDDTGKRATRRTISVECRSCGTLGLSMADELREVEAAKKHREFEPGHIVDIVKIEEVFVYDLHQREILQTLGP